MNQTDVCIVGAGPAGASAALHLANAGLGSVLLDKARFPRDKICGDALSGKVMVEIDRLGQGLPEALRQSRAALGSGGIVFAAPGGESVRLPFQAPGADYGGYLIRRLDFDDLLVRAVRANPRITLREETELTGFERNTAGGWTLRTRAGDVIQTRILLVANGAQSAFSRQVAGFEKEPEHDSAGLRAYYHGVRDLDPEGYIELHFLKPFLPGYLWIFPLPNGYANVGVGLLNSEIARRRVNLKAEMLRLLETHPTLRERFRNARLDGDIRGYGLPLGSKRRVLSGDGYLLLGDAAHLIDPFTGEGISNALISGRWAATWAQRALAAGDTSGTFLRQYDTAVYNRLGKEFQISHRLQQLSRYPALFNFAIRKANRNPAFQQLLSSMFVDLDLRAELKKPQFYLKLLFT
jgi:geranylgeranyl reductase family protein